MARKLHLLGSQTHLRHDNGGHLICCEPRNVLDVGSFRAARYAYAYDWSLTSPTNTDGVQMLMTEWESEPWNNNNSHAVANWSQGFGGGGSWEARVTVHGISLSYISYPPNNQVNDNELIDTGFIQHLEFFVGYYKVAAGAGEARVALFQADTSINLGTEFPTYASVANLPFVPINGVGTYTFPYSGRFHRTMLFFSYFKGFIPPSAAGNAGFRIDGASAWCTHLLPQGYQ